MDLLFAIFFKPKLCLTCVIVRINGVWLTEILAYELRSVDMPNKNITMGISIFHLIRLSQFCFPLTLTHHKIKHRFPWVAISLGNELDPFIVVETEMETPPRASSVLQIKQNNGLYPNNFVNDVLNDAPGGVSISVSTTIHGSKFIAKGYRYSRKTMLYFIMG